MVYEMVLYGPKDDPFAKVGVVSSNLIARSNNRTAIKQIPPDFGAFIGNIQATQGNRS